MSEKITEKLKSTEKAAAKDTFIFLNWALFGILVGIVAGAISAAFGLLLTNITAFRSAHPQLIFGLPFAGLAIVFLYYHLGDKGDKGTNLVLNSVRDEGAVPWYVAVRIFIATALTHLFGGSAGREGAALQLGGSVASTIAKLIHFDKQDQKAVIMCGMSAAFAALFGTPLASCVFAMEVVNVGEMYYSALVPCAFSAIVGQMVAMAMGCEPEVFGVDLIPQMTAVTFAETVLLGVCCAGLAILFIVVLHLSHHFFHMEFWNKYASVFCSGCILIVLNLLVGTTDYMGAGMNVIARAVEGEVRPEAFLLKIIFTALTLGACYKGGEIVPAFYVGATFGCLFGNLIGLSPSMCAAVGMVSVFCGVTNCPLASLLIASELFGFGGIYYYLIGVAVSYTLSGYYSLYSSQNIKFGKYKLRLKHRANTDID